MSQDIADSIKDNLREQIELLQSMCVIYPGDPTGDITLDCMVMQEIIDTIDEYDWNLLREELRKEIPKVEITYD